MKRYRQLSLDERYQIAALLKQRTSAANIALKLGRDRSTVSRELKRNGDQYGSIGYNAPRAENKAHARRVAKGVTQRKITGELQVLVEQKLRLSWSPEHIAGRLKLEKSRWHVCAETIYQHILRNSKELGFYRYCLRFGGYKHHRFKKSKMAERTRMRKKWIKDRPVAANERAQLGHWERDCLLGKRGGSAFLTMIDRKSRYLRIAHVKNVDTDTVAAATKRSLRSEFVRTITNDNGLEFARDQELQEEMGVPVYFCEPSSPWQRGSIENANGLIRQYFRKGANLDRLPHWVANAIEETLNFRPRKVLGYRTPHEIHRNQTLTLVGNEEMHFGLKFSSRN